MAASPTGRPSERPGAQYSTAGATSGQKGISSPSPLSTPDRLRDDLADAGLPEYDDEGYTLVFHSFRDTTGTWLCENGVDLKVVQEVLSYKTFAMTADRYTHARLVRVAAEMAKRPEPMATGTDDSAGAGLA